MASSTPTTSQPTFASGVYKLKNVATGTLLDLWNGETNEGTIIQGHGDNGATNLKARAGAQHITHRKCQCGH
ncbi:hypothetical protein RHS01_10596 [Rhizoctonia solani]|uniref:Pectate lyase n=1 Tax=Rhizoctonia solani TaxID=456999 RepID=A0A8H7I4Q3_9AGAM|nr:hypothetical protein RHS01_10596 [Rhizoctonia solani]